MKERKGLIIVVTTLVFSILACQVVSVNIGDWQTVRGSGNVVEETRSVSGVTGVELATIGDLVIEVGDSESLRIEAEDNLLEYFDTEVRSGKLRIETRDNVNLRTTRPVNYYLTVKSLESIVISSSGDIQAPDLEADRLSITISSSGNLVMGDLKAEALKVKISSSGDVTIGLLNANSLGVDITSSGNLDIAGGEITLQNITITSSGKYNAQRLQSDDAEVRLTSSGSATIWVLDHLKAFLSSSGNLSYRGDPTVDSTTTSSGDVIHIGD